MRILALAAHAALAVVIAVAPAFADVHVNKAAGISIDVPKDWKLGGGGNAMVASDPKEEAAVSLIITDTGDVKKAADALDSQLSRTMTEVKLENATKIDLNGLAALEMKGGAKMGTKKVGLLVMIVMTPIGKAMNVIAVVEESKFEVHKKELVGVLMSIKAAK